MLLDFVWVKYIDLASLSLHRGKIPCGEGLACKDATTQRVGVCTAKPPPAVQPLQPIDTASVGAPGGATFNLSSLAGDVEQDGLEVVLVAPNSGIMHSTGSLYFFNLFANVGPDQLPSECRAVPPSSNVQ